MTLSLPVIVPAPPADRGDADRTAARPLAPGIAHLVALTLAFGAMAPAAAGDGRSIHVAKAEALANLARFVEWPSPARGAGGQLTFIILGDDELAVAIAAELSRKTIHGREVFVRCVRRAADVRDGQVLYIASSEAQRIPEIVLAVRDSAVLTVADVPEFAARGGMIGFVQQDDRVRIEVNLESAQRARLKLSSRLLALSTIVAQTR